VGTITDAIASSPISRDAKRSLGDEVHARGCCNFAGNDLVHTELLAGPARAMRVRESRPLDESEARL
jgi:hypothetical protein